MVQPVTLIEPMLVTIEQIDKSQATGTPPVSGVSGRRWPQNHVPRKTEITLEAQVVFGDRDQKGNFTQMGTNEEQKGYILVRFQDLVDGNIELKRGDKITKLVAKGRALETELFLQHSTGDLSAHVGGEFGLTRITFMDRNPEGRSGN